MPPRREPGNARVVDLFKNRDGTESARYKQLKAKGLTTTQLREYKNWAVKWVDLAGKEKSRTFKRRIDADQYRVKIESDIMRGEYIDRAHGQITVEEVWRRWEPTQATRAKKTRYDRQGNWRRYVQPRWGGTAIARITKSDVQLWIAELHEEGYSVSTLEHALEVLRLVLGFAVEEGHLLKNPASGIPLPARKPEDRYYLTVPQVETLANCIGQDYGLMIRVLAYCGPRFGEVAALRGKDILLDRRRIWLRRAVSRPGGKAEIKDLKNHRARMVAYPQQLHDALASRAAEVGSEGLLFTSPEGGVLNDSNFHTRTYGPAKAKVREVLGEEFPLLTLHDLRHTAASLAVRSGANVKIVQLMLGHASASMTLDTYSDLFPDDLDRVADAMSHLLSGEG
ncbi:tyrosine-type recombinase/integrase [Corynebacterium mastitidis]|uniref:tyrosine-type recombinase/integrase n=1 Tax=Corynebacterium mastitidis TaxID=161890 RepID=UPI001F13A06E|nr:site-specific integrase [Corynebacterium mastitidis]MCH6197520.1 tyrosine-type recombinase/integrase [Corynebacterium mastitidis]